MGQQTQTKQVLIMLQQQQQNQNKQMEKSDESAGTVDEVNIIEIDDHVET